MNGKTQYGLVVCSHVDDYMNGKIKKHELTRRDKEEDRMKHVRVNNANIEPVFFAYPDNKDLDKIIASVISLSLIHICSPSERSTSKYFSPIKFGTFSCEYKR